MKLSGNGESSFAENSRPQEKKIFWNEEKLSNVNSIFHELVQHKYSIFFMEGKCFVLILFPMQLNELFIDARRSSKL